MKRMFNNKRGISPLIATIMLLAFAIALGSIVMTWGKDLIESAANEPTAEVLEDSLAILQKCVDTGSINQDEFTQISSNLFGET